MTSLKFQCPTCKRRRLEEVCEDIVTYQVITLDESGDYDVTGKVENYDGEIIRYQCAHCGYTLKKGKDCIYNPEDAARWMIVNVKQEVNSA